MGSVVGQAPAGKNFTVGIVQFVSHPALDAARKGTLDALADNGYKDGTNLKIDVQNGQGDVGDGRTASPSGSRTPTPTWWSPSRRRRTRRC